MLQKYTLIILLLFRFSFAYNQNITISGYICDKETGEKLIGTTIFENKNKSGTISNNYGYYSLTTSCIDTVEIVYSYIGYESLIKKITKNEDTRVDVFLYQSTNTLESVEITGESKSCNKVEMSIAEISIKNLDKMPTLAGETDIFRVFQLMSGVQGGNEGTSSLYVRGGSPDQNLIILDEIPLYYVNHIGGFFSVFDEDALNSVTLYKGGFPARYGGRLSSVIDISLKNGNFNKLSCKYSFGVMSSKFLIEGPWGNNKSSFLFSIRRCNLDALMYIGSKLYSNDNFIGTYGFYDTNLKVNKKLNDKNNLIISIYNGKDKIYMQDKNFYVGYYTKDVGKIMWGNLITSFRLNHIHNKKLFSNSSIAFSKYYYTNQLKYSQISASNKTSEDVKFNSNIDDIIFKIDFDYFLNKKNKIKFGLSDVYHFSRPEIKKYNNSEQDTTLNKKSILANEISIYFEDEIKINNKISTNFGLHGNIYITSKTSFYSLQPRLLINYKFIEKASLKVSFSKMTQNIHLLTNNTSGLPTDIWMPATKNTIPENSYQYAIGTAFSIKKLDFSIESYYKKLENLIEFREGIAFYGNSRNWEKIIEKDGIAEIYGIEFMLNKTIGNFTGWISYTYSKNYRKFKAFNNGNFYPYKYDRRNDFSIVGMIKINDKITISLTWVYSSGINLTFPVAKYSSNIDYYSDIYLYSGKNSFKTPPYHRADLSINKELKTTKGTKFINFSIYNLYNKMNAYYYFLDNNFNGELGFYQLILFPIIPSISYSFKF